MYLQDVGGDENFHLFLQPLDGKPAKDLTNFEGVRAQNLVTDKHFPGEVKPLAFLQLARVFGNNYLCSLCAAVILTIFITANCSITVCVCSCVLRSSCPS